MVIARFAMSKRCTRFVDGKFFLNDSGLTISPLDGNTFDQDFLNYHILSLNDEIYSLARGTAQKNLNVNAFKKVKLSYPTSLEEQKQIVAKLDQCFEAIDKAKANAAKNLENAKELFQSKLNEIFSQKGEGWVEKELGAACLITMGQSPKGTSYNQEGEGVPLINGPVEFGKDSFDKTIKSKFTTEPTKMCRQGDLILCVRGSTTGKINIAGFDACIGRGVASIRFDQNQRWLDYFIRSKRNEIYSLGTGSTFPNVSRTILSKLPFLIPPVEQQNVFVETMDKLLSFTNLLQVKYQQELNSLEELKKSILQKAFEGEL
jgi:type I restriction enzyme S subunit